MPSMIGLVAIAICAVRNSLSSITASSTGVLHGKLITVIPSQGAVPTISEISIQCALAAIEAREQNAAKHIERKVG